MKREAKKVNPDMRTLYDQQAEAFATQAPELFWWHCMGQPTFDRNLGEFYNRDDVLALDLGSASARVAQYLITKGIPPKNHTGIEIAPKQVEIARKRVPEARFMVGDIRDTKLPSNHFDLATSNMVFEFLDNEGLQQALTNTHRSLKPGGVLFYIVTHPDRVRDRYSVEKEGWYETSFPWGDTGQNYHRPVAAFRQTTEEAGFIIENVEELEVPPEALEKHPDQKDRYPTGVKARLVVKARKPTA